MRRCSAPDLVTSKINITCTECKFPYFAVEEIKQSVARSTQHDSNLSINQVIDELAVLDDALEL